MNWAWAPDAYWRQTPRSLVLALEGGWKRIAREDKGRRYLAWYSAAPHWGKGFPSLDIFVNGRPATTLDVETSMDLWVLASRPAAAQSR